MAAWVAVAYSFDDIKGTVTLLTALYSDVNAAELVQGGKPAVSSYVLKILGSLRQQLNKDDRQRFDLVVAKLIETKLNAHHLPSEQ